MFWCEPDDALTRSKHVATLKNTKDFKRGNGVIIPLYLLIITLSDAEIT